MQLLLCSNFLDKMLCVLGTFGLCVYQLIAAVKKSTALVFVELYPPEAPRQVLEKFSAAGEGDGFERL